MATVGYIVRGAHGDMVLSVRDGQLYFGHRGRCTLFADRRAALRAIRFTEKQNPGKDWLDMRLSRVEQAKGGR